MPPSEAEVLQAAVDAAGGIDKARPDGWAREAWRKHCRDHDVKYTRPTTTVPAAVKWGLGAAQPVRPATTEDTELVVFLSDIHVPYHDPDVVASALRLIRRLKPHRVVLNGDIADFFQLSRFNTAQSRMDDLQAEIDDANLIREGVRAAAPDAVIDETEGNHDSRTSTYVANNARALKSLRALEPENLFKYRELNINWHPGAGFLLRQNFLVKHGTIVRKDGGASAKAEMEQAGVSGISGHVHRLATYRKAGYSQRQWTEQGCLCRTDPDYVVGAPNWVQGCVVGEFSTRSDVFVTYEVPAVDGRLRFGGKAY